MAEQSEHDSLPSPPPLPRRLADPVPAIVGGTVLWTIAFVVFLIINPEDAVWTWASFAGAVLGVMGYGVFSWQRRAARRGSRGAQTGV